MSSVMVGVFTLAAALEKMPLFAYVGLGPDVVFYLVTE